MKALTLGKTGLSVSRLGFGGIPIIRLGFEEAVAVVRHCFDRGITFFDTANAYNDSENRIGHALQSVRDQVVFATKTLERDSETVAKHIDQSLTNLKTSKIELYQFHQVGNEETLSRVLAPGGAYEAVENARAEGKVDFVGLSSHDIPTAIKACRTDLFHTVQVPFNFIEHDAEEELFDVARERDMAIIAMKPLGGGLLDRADLCFRFLLQYPDVVPIAGIQTKEEIDEILDVYLSPGALTGGDWDEIQEIRTDLGTRFCRRCEYCMPCEKGVKIPQVVRFMSFPKRFTPSAVISMVKADMESVPKCDECWECAQRCPYDLPIPDLLKENLSLFNDFMKNHC